MAPLAGTYEFVSQDNFVAYLQSLGMSAEAAEKSAKRDTVVIGPIESDKITITFGDSAMEFTLNKELEYSFLGGIKKKALATVNGDVITIKTKLADDGSLEEEKVITPTDSGLVVVSSNTTGAKGERRYKRV